MAHSVFDRFHAKVLNEELREICALRITDLLRYITDNAILCDQHVGRFLHPDVLNIRMYCDSLDLLEKITQIGRGETCQVRDLLQVDFFIIVVAYVLLDEVEVFPRVSFGRRESLRLQIELRCGE